jgi:23S rRNA (adenine2503-C2)-methyltransferase
MTNIPESLRQTLDENYSFLLLNIINISHSIRDNSYKFLLETEDKKIIESICIIQKNRATLCLSCMIGCPLKCVFCATGSLVKFVRKLTSAEIIGQYCTILNYIKQNNIFNKITNIVFMGMGEPFLNIPEIEKSLDVFLDTSCLSFSRSRITISTAGVKAPIAEIINKYRVKLAVSIHFPTDELRAKYMPVAKSLSLKDLIIELKKIKLSYRDSIMIEYIMINNINDQIAHANQLVKLVSDLKVKINLIPYNPTENFPEKPSTEENINTFAQYLKNKSLMVTVRRSAGTDISGGCGQFVLKRK